MTQDEPPAPGPDAQPGDDRTDGPRSDAGDGADGNEADDTRAADASGAARTTPEDDPGGAGPSHGRSPHTPSEGGSTQGRSLARAGGPTAHALTPPRRTGVFLDPEDLRTHVGELLRVVLGGYEVDAFGNFTFLHEGARIFVTIAGTPIGPQVGVFSVTNLDIPLTPELSRFLLTHNHTMAFGAFSYDPNNEAVWLRHTLLGSTLDLPELQTALAAVATTAAAIDETIQGRFGGRTFQQAPDEVQRRMEPPEPRADTGNASGYL